VSRLIVCNSTCGAGSTRTDLTGSASSSSVALDSSNNAFVVNSSNSGIRYTKLNSAGSIVGGPIVIDATTSNTSVGNRSITVASDGFARIADVTASGTVNFVRCVDAGCTASRVTTVITTGGGLTSSFPSVVMSSIDGFARIGYQTGVSTFTQWYAQCVNISCTSPSLTQLSTTGAVVAGSMSGIATGLDGYSRVYYFVGNFASIWVESTYTGTVITAVDTTGNVGQYSSTAIGSDGYSRIAYYDATNGDLKFAQCTNGPCTSKVITSVDTTGDVGRYTAIAMGSDGFARISYVDAANLKPKFVQCLNADCSSHSTPVIIDALTNVWGLYNSIAMDPVTGFARISYFDAVGGAQQLRYAQCTIADCSTKVTTNVDTATDVGLYTSIAVNSGGLARISYYDQNLKDLKYVQCGDAACDATGRVITSVDTTGDVGQNTSIALGTDGFARISYYDATNVSLKFVQCTDAACSSGHRNITFVDNGNTGRYSTIAMGTDGFARIGYFDGANAWLKYVKCTNAACTTKSMLTADSGPGNYNVGQYASIAVGTDGWARISYFRSDTNSDLKLWLEDTSAGTPAAASFYYSVNPSSGAAGAASTVFTVGMKDIGGNVITAPSNTNVYMYSSGSGGTFSATSGGSYTTALNEVITTGSASTDFYYKNNSTSGNPYVITASDNSSAPDGATGLVDATANYTINAGTATVATLAPASQTVTAGVASSVVTLTTKDSLGNSSNVASNTTFTLSSTLSGGQFSVLASPFTPITTVTVNSGTSSTTFFYRNNTAGSYTITATAASGFTPAPTAAITVTPAALASFYYATAPASGTAGSPSTVFTVGAHDSFGNVVTVASNTNVYLYSSGSGGTFSTTSGGTYTSALTVVITSGGTTTNYFYKNSSTAGSPYTLTASDNSSAPDGATGIVDATTSYAVNAGTATVTTLTPASQTVTAGSPSSVLTLTTKDSLGNASNVASNTTFTLTSSGSGGTFSTSGSGGPYTATNVTINAGSSSATFYYLNQTSGSYTITTHNAGFSPDSTATVTVNPAAIAQYYFATAPASGTAGSASTAFTVGVKDTYGNIIGSPASNTVSFYSSGTGGTFSVSSGGTYTSTFSETISAGSPTVSFFYKNNSTTGSPYTITASDNPSAPDGATGIVDATTSYALNAAAASVAVLTPASQSVAAGVASSVVTLTTKDSLGNVSNVASNTTFALSSSGTGGTFSTTSGGTYTTTLNVTVNSGTSTTTFFFKNNTAGSYTITAHNASFTDGTATITVNAAAIASFYYATAPASGAAGVASTVFTVGAHDSFGNVVTVGSNTNVYLYSSAPAGTFSTTSGGTYTSALTVVILSGGTTTNFFYKNNSTSGSPYTITASDNSSAPDGATGIVDATTSYTVNPGSASVAVLTPATQTVTANLPSSVITLTTKDGLGNTVAVGSNTTFTLSDADGGQYSILSSPFTPVSTVTVNSGSSSATFYYKNTTPGVYTVTAHNAGFTDGTTTITVNQANIVSYYYATAPASGAAGVSSTVFTVGAHDAFGNVVTVASNVTVYLYSSAPAGTFSNTTSAGPFTATSTTITTGNTTADFYYKNNSTSGSPYTLTVSDNSSAPDGATGIVDTTTSYSVTAGTATVAVLTPSSQSTTAGVATSVITLTTKDSLGNITPVASNTTFTLSDADGGQFSILATPFTPVSTITVNGGNSTATFFYKNNTSGVYTVTAHNAGFTDGTTTITVNSGSIASYYFVSAPSSANISVASGAFVVGAHDIFGNVVTVGSNTTVYLYSSAASGTFSNSGSGGPYTATTVTILAGNTTATFYYKDPIANPVTITASDQTPTHTPDTGIVDANTAFTVFNPDVVVGPNMPLPVRSATLDDSRPGDPNVHFSWNSTTVSTIKAIRIQLCTDGLKNTACTKPTGSDLTPVTLTSTGGELGASGWSITTVVSDHELLFTNSTGAATTIGGTSTLDIANFVNPTTIGTFFFRISTYTTTVAAPGDSVGYGAIADSTARSLTVTGDVAESLVFRVANSVASDCSSQTDIADPNDATSDLVTLSPNPMTMSTTSIGTAQMCATSNAQHGYTITYYDAALGGATKGFWNGAHEFAVANQFTSTQGTEQFGFNLRANTTPAVGFDPDGNGLVADLTNADYGTVDRFSYNDTGSSTILAQKSSPNAATARYTMSYIANISSTTQGGTYKAHQIFVLTATY